MQFFKENLGSSNEFFQGRTFNIDHGHYKFEFFEISSISDSKLHIALDIMQDHYLSVIHSLQNKVDFDTFNNNNFFQNSINLDLEILGTIKNLFNKITETEKSRLSGLQLTINSAEYELKQIYSPQFEDKNEFSFTQVSFINNQIILKIKILLDDLVDKISKENLEKIYKSLSIRNDKNEATVINGIISLILNVHSAKPSTCAKYVRNYELFKESLKKFNGCNINKEYYQNISKEFCAVLPLITTNIQKGLNSLDQFTVDYSHMYIFRDWLLNALELAKLCIQFNFTKEKEALDLIYLKKLNYYNTIKEKIKVKKEDLTNSLFELIEVGKELINNAISYINDIRDTYKNSLILGKCSNNNILNFNTEFEKDISILYSKNKINIPKKYLKRDDKINFEQNCQIRFKGNSLCFLKECLNK